jgi:hypothetical protein
MTDNAIIRLTHFVKCNERSISLYSLALDRSDTQARSPIGAGARHIIDSRELQLEVVNLLKLLANRS